MNNKALGLIAAIAIAIMIPLLSIQLVLFEMKVIKLFEQVTNILEKHQ